MFNLLFRFVFYMLFLVGIMYYGFKTFESIGRNMDKIKEAQEKARNPQSWTSELQAPRDLKEGDSADKVFVKVFSKNLSAWKKSGNPLARKIVDFEEKTKPQAKIESGGFKIKSKGDLKTRSVKSTIFYGDFKLKYQIEMYTGSELRLDYPLVDNAETYCSYKDNEVLFNYKKEF